MTQTPPAPITRPQPPPSGGLWPWAWLILVLIACIPNGILIYNAYRLKPASVGTLPYEASKQFDRHKAERRAFKGLGFHLEAVSPGNGQVQFRLDGPGPLQAVEIRFIRPADARLDRVLRWPDTSEALAVALPGRGLWQVEIQGHYGDRIVAHRLTLPDV